MTLHGEQSQAKVSIGCLTGETLSPDDICAVFAELAPDPSWAFAGLTPSQTNYLTHGYHRYPAKFIPQVVERLMDELLPPQTKPFHVNDLFMGSGTTIACAIARGCIASGTDINDVAYLITRAKATPIEPSYLKRKADRLLSQLDTTPSLFRVSHIEPYIPDNERIDYWFEPAVKEKLGILLSLIRSEEDEQVRTFFLCGFSHILKPCSRWLAGSVKPTRAKVKKPSDPFVVFRQHTRKMLRGNSEFYAVVPDEVKRNLGYYLRIVRGDAKYQPCDDDSVDIQITSSPYVTSYEYADLHQLSLIWLEYAKDLRDYRQQFIGSAYHNGRQACFQSTIARSIVEQLRKRDRGMSEEVAVYFSDMEKCFRETYRILKPGGFACYVIGDTVLRGVKILNAEVFAETMQLVGFELHRIIKRRIPSKILPQTRDAETGKFAKTVEADFEAYPEEYIIIGRKP